MLTIKSPKVDATWRFYFICDFIFFKGFGRALGLVAFKLQFVNKNKLGVRNHFLIKSIMGFICFDA
jgi:hypothetical protein